MKLFSKQVWQMVGNPEITEKTLVKDYADFETMFNKLHGKELTYDQLRRCNAIDEFKGSDLLSYIKTLAVAASLLQEKR
jgi:hypothetical protein